MKNPIIIFMEWVDETLFATAGKVSPWLMPVPSGLILGWTFGVNMITLWGKSVAEGAGWCATAGAIGLGAYASHNAIKRGGAWWWLVAGHAVLVIAALLILDAAEHIKGIGIILELMTVLSYIAQAGARQTEIEHQRIEAEAAEVERKRIEAEAKAEAQRREDEQKRREDEQREADRLAGIEAERMRLEHEERMAKIEADKQARIARANTPKVVQRGVQNNGVEQPNELTPDEQKAAIIKAVSSGDDVNWSKLAAELAVSRGTIYNRRAELIEHGIIHEVDGRFVTNGNQTTNGNGAH